MNADFCQVEIDKAGDNMIFSYHPLLKTNSDQEQDNAIHHPTLPESIEQLVEWIINYDFVWKLSDWERILHVYLFLADLLEDIMDFHPLLLFFW